MTGCLVCLELACFGGGVALGEMGRRTQLRSIAQEGRGQGVGMLTQPVV